MLNILFKSNVSIFFWGRAYTEEIAKLFFNLIISDSIDVVSMPITMQFRLFFIYMATPSLGVFPGRSFLNHW